MAGLLEVHDLSVRFGGLLALDKVSLQVREGAFCGVIGPNGAGKTTLFNAISRFVPTDGGDIVMDGRKITTVKPHEVQDAGVARTFQHLGVFRSLTVEENIIAAGLARSGIGVIAELLRMPAAISKRRLLRSHAHALAELCGLSGQLYDHAANLPFGRQKRLELARALANRPKLLLLDEPAGGLSRREVDDFLVLLLDIKQRFNLTIVMIEHHLGLVMKASDQIVVLNFGRKIAEGNAAELRNNAEVIAAYLGHRQ